MNIFQILYSFISTRLMSDAQKDLEILALRSQLAIVQQHMINHKMAKPRCNNTFRHLWVFLSKYFLTWKSALVLFKPDTVIRWHHRLFLIYWKRKSRGGRPPISRATIALIKRIHKENPLLSPEKIYERLIALNIADAPAPNSIAKYIRAPRKPSTDTQKQSWQSFLYNHVKEIWAMDFAVVPTLTFKPLYVLLIISHGRRKIEHFSVTEHPTAQWLIQQIRNATPFGKQPKYLVHDNDSSFLSRPFQGFLDKCNIISTRTGFHCPWQNGICERLIGILRRELLDHIIPLNQRHLERLLVEYVIYYNTVRTHQALAGETLVKSTLPPETAAEDTILYGRPILGGLYHDYQKAS